MSRPAVLRLQVHAGTLGFSHWGWGSRDWSSSCMHGKHISHRAISPAPVKYIKSSNLGWVEKCLEHLWFKQGKTHTHSDLSTFQGSLWKILAANLSPLKEGVVLCGLINAAKTKCTFSKELHVGQMCLEQLCFACYGSMHHHHQQDHWPALYLRMVIVPMMGILLFPPGYQPSLSTYSMSYPLAGRVLF